MPSKSDKNRPIRADWVVIVNIIHNIRDALSNSTIVFFIRRKFLIPKESYCGGQSTSSKCDKFSTTDTGDYRFSNKCSPVSGNRKRTSLSSSNVSSKNNSPFMTTKSPTKITGEHDTILANTMQQKIGRDRTNET
eukprot:154455_1